MILKSIIFSKSPCSFCFLPFPQMQLLNSPVSEGTLEIQVHAVQVIHRTNLMFVWFYLPPEVAAVAGLTLLSWVRTNTRALFIIAFTGNTF